MNKNSFFPVILCYGFKCETMRQERITNNIHSEYKRVLDATHDFFYFVCIQNIVVLFGISILPFSFLNNIKF